MKTLSLTDELAKVVQYVIWFEKPGEALADAIRFVTYAMTYGTHKDMKSSGTISPMMICAKR